MSFITPILSGRGCCADPDCGAKAKAAPMRSICRRSSAFPIFIRSSRCWPIVQQPSARGNNDRTSSPSRPFAARAESQIVNALICEMDSDGRDGGPAMSVNFLDHIKTVEDHRIPGMTTYPLDEVLLTVLVGLLCRMEDFDEIAMFGEGQ